MIILKKISEIIKLLRIKHWIKNILIVLALFFSGKLLSSNDIIMCVFGFFSFSFMASAVYIFNDIVDVENDKRHSIKKERPLASGKISIKFAIIIMVVMAFLSLFINIFFINNHYSVILLCLYGILNVLYSLYLKKIPIIDVFILVSGFLIRTYYGAFIIDVEISKWLYLTVMMISFFMAFGKRKNEIIMYKSKTREVLKYYNKEFLDKYMYVSLVLTIVFYSLWSIDDNTLNRIGNDYFIYTIPLVFIIFMKYTLTLKSDSYGNPVDILFKDKTLLFLIILLSFMMIMIMYIL